jgi:hypothetical protein
LHSGWGGCNVNGRFFGSLYFVFFAFEVVEFRVQYVAVLNSDYMLNTQFDLFSSLKVVVSTPRALACKLSTMHCYLITIAVADLEGDPGPPFCPKFTIDEMLVKLKICDFSPEISGFATSSICHFH